MRKLGLAVVISLIAAASAHSQVLFTGNYTQAFDSLATTGTTNTWTNNATLTGWYSSRTVYLATDGSSNTGGLYSFGTGGSSERAMGSIGSNATDTIQYGVQVRNTTGATLSTLTIAYTGEEWRNGGNTTAHALTFAYSANATSLTSGTYTAVSALNFTSPIATATAGTLNGNAGANSQSLSFNLTGLNLAPGADLWLRWTDLNDAGNDHGLSIDNVTVTSAAPVVTVPESGSLTLASLGILALAGALARRRISGKTA